MTRGPRAATLLVPLLAWATAAVAQAPAEIAVPSLASDRYDRRPGFDVLHYEIEIEVPAEGAAITGRTAVLYEAGTDLEEVRLELGGAMVVDSVTVDGRSAAFTHEGVRLTIRDPGTGVRSRGEATVWYHGAPADGLIVGYSRHGRRAIFADNWADRAHHWFPSLDHPSDKATVELVVVAPSDLEVVGNGILAERFDLGDGRARTRWIESAEIPVYGMVVGIADFAVVQAGVVDGIEVSHWTFPEDSAAGAVAFARSTEILAFYDSLFGPYPYEKLAHVQSATKFGGMENPGAILSSILKAGSCTPAASPPRRGSVRLEFGPCPGDIPSGDQRPALRVGPRPPGDVRGRRREREVDPDREAGRFLARRRARGGDGAGARHHPGR